MPLEWSCWPIGHGGRTVPSVGAAGLHAGRPTGRRQANGLGWPAQGGESPVAEAAWSGQWMGCVSTTGHVEACGKLGRPRSKAKYPLKRPIVDQYREGPVKSTPVRGVKQHLNPSAHTQSEGVWPWLFAEPGAGLMACLWKYEPASGSAAAQVAKSLVKGPSRERKRV